MSPAASASQESARAWRPDALLALSLAVLLGLGVVLVYSSSSVYAGRLYGDPQRFLKAQLMWTAVGLVAMCVTACVPRRWLAARPGWWVLLAMAMCAAVLIPGVGHLVGGARRWLVLGPVTCQPSEATKLAVVVLLAARAATPPQLQKPCRHPKLSR
jgi:cell division protein FtsW